MCTGKFDCHNFIRREKKGGQRASFSVILKYIVFIVKKYWRFWLVNLKRSSSNRKRILPCCQILKKFTEGNWRNRDKKIADKFTKSKFCKIKNCASENNICFTRRPRNRATARVQTPGRGHRAWGPTSLLRSHLQMAFPERDRWRATAAHGMGMSLIYVMSF